MTSDNFSG